jgi:hypothetical protein
MTTTLQRAVSRNDPCPCGSGRRFKDCHGSLRDGAAGPAQPVTLRKSQYRPAGDDWATLSEDDRDRLGALMELALRHQLEQRIRDAERTYRAVLEQAPRTHDALHMLGVVRLGLGDFSDAERLIRAAMALRPSYPAIETNWSLVRRSIAARDRRGIEVVCEHALPLLCESIGAGGYPRTVDSTASLHIVGASSDALSDDDWMTRRLTALLAPLGPLTWHTEAQVTPERWQPFDRQAIDPATVRQPRAGDVILSSVECDTDAWLREPIDRALVFTRSARPSLCLERLRRIAADGARSIAFVFESHAKARRFGRSEYVVPPPIDLAEYASVHRDERARSSSTLRVATSGQDGRRVAVADDVELLKRVAARAGVLSVFDPGPLRYDVGMMSTVECIPRGARTLSDVVAGSDVYLHRVMPWWAEDLGRALFGAMARW